MFHLDFLEVHLTVQVLREYLLLHLFVHYLQLIVNAIHLQIHQLVLGMHLEHHHHLHHHHLWLSLDYMLLQKLNWLHYYLHNRKYMLQHLLHQ